MPRGKPRKAPPEADTYQHKDKQSLLRPDIGLQAQFKQKKPTASTVVGPIRF